MKSFLLAVLIVLFPLSAVVANADQAYTEVDREMIRFLDLDNDQARIYRQIIGVQRVQFLALAPGEWQQELALYHETFALLQPVLTTQQYTLFVGVINSFVEHAEVEAVLAMQ